MDIKFRQVIYGFFPIVVMMLVQNLLVFLGAGALAFWGVMDQQITDPAQLYNSLAEQVYTSEFNMGISIAYSIVCGVIFFIWYRKVRNTPSHENFAGYRPWIIPGILMLAVALQFLTGYITEVASVAAPAWVAEYEILLSQVGLTEDSVSIGLILYTVLLAPIVEELCFRGLTYNYLRRGISLQAAVVVQALLFAGFHGNFFQASYTLVFGLFVGFIYAKSENIYLTIALHMGYNFIAMFASQWIYLGENAISFYCILLTTMVACYVGLMLVMYSIPRLAENHK